ncbi:branched-chain amino acid ABC transporter permease [Stappia sp. 28M-7]|uniref:branched-chain amino acid ABC transporter permease n=1 Tax=Stappia sp. 28M-7 TaxID=2762596 RepID=UPI00163C1D66|nr:branched-chain amino acid ABC transporter permease [Stappia sp. 28M-7]MBC2860530.1 branched-chain amino acid ABC transporter permease [Stappia sp. 28M-7]
MTLTRKNGLLYLVILAGLIVLPSFISTKYYIHLSVLALIWVIVAQGQNLIQGFTGYVSIAQAGFMGIGAYGTALLGLNFGLPVWLTILSAPLITALFALVAGYPSLRVKGHYFAIVTLAFNMVIFIVLLNLTDLTNGEAGLMGIPKPGAGKDGVINFADRTTYYYFVLIAATGVTALTALIVNSRLGRVLVAIRQNETLVGAAGLAAWKYKLFAFVVSAMFAGFAGALYAHYQSFINPEIFTIAQSMDAVLAVILGGSGTITGPIIGAFAIVFLPEYLRFADSFRLVIYGLILILATIFMPRGIVGLASDALGLLKKRRAR